MPLSNSTHSLSSMFKIIFGLCFFPLVDPCQRYKTLNSSDRNIKTKSSVESCDNSLPTGWYRFQGEAGTRLPTKCPPRDRCHTKSPGWLNVALTPLPLVGVKKKIIVCFQHINKNNCCDQNEAIYIKNCSSYFVYKLCPTPGCNLRYCGTD